MLLQMAKFHSFLWLSSIPYMYVSSISSLTLLFMFFLIIAILTDVRWWWLGFWLAFSLMFLAAQSCLIICDPTGCSLPGFSVHGMLQARILEWVAISSSRGSTSKSPALQADSLPCEPPGKPDDYECWESFHVPVGHLLFLFEKILFGYSAYYVIGLRVYVCVCGYWVVWAVCLCWIVIPYWSYHLQISSPNQ